MSNLKSLATANLTGSNLVVEVLTDKLREADVAYRLRDEIKAQIDQQKPAHVVLDLARVDFIGSVGFLAFLGVRRQLPQGRIVLCNLSGPTRDIFAICNLIPTETKRSAPFEVADNVDQALALLAS